MKSKKEEANLPTYEIRTASNGDLCIMSTKFNIRIATFSKGTAVDAEAIGKLLSQPERTTLPFDVDDQLKLELQQNEWAATNLGRELHPAYNLGFEAAWRRACAAIEKAFKQK